MGPIDTHEESLLRHFMPVKKYFMNVIKSFKDVVMVFT